MRGKRAKQLRRKAAGQARGIFDYKKKYKQAKNWWKNLTTPEKEKYAEGLK